MRIFLLISAFLALSPTLAQDSNYQIGTLNEDLTQNANAVVRLDEMEIELLAVNRVSSFQDNPLNSSKLFRFRGCFNANYFVFLHKYFAYGTIYLPASAQN